MKLPILISVPHAGSTVPDEVQPYCILKKDDIIADGDEGAQEIYAVEKEVVAFVSTSIARAVIDVNREENDRRADGIVKRKTIWGVTVYKTFPPEDVIRTLIEKYYLPYHDEISRSLKSGVILGVDCHTMTAFSPPIEPDHGRARPPICLSNADGSLPQEWMNIAVLCFRNAFGTEISVNSPFKGGYIIRTHSEELPWLQVELSRGLAMSNEDKRNRFLHALSCVCDTVQESGP